MLGEGRETVNRSRTSVYFFDINTIICCSEGYPTYIDRDPVTISTTV